VTLETTAPAPAPEQVPGASPAQRLAPGDQDLIIKVKGIDDLLVYRAKCCNPIRGEAIVGYVTRGKGIAVHSTNCPNVQNLMYEIERKIDVEWARATADAFPVKVVVHTDDRPGMLNQLTSVLFNEQSDIRTLEARSDDKRAGDGAVIDMTIEIRDKKQLERVVSAIRRISGVRDVERIQ
jgi:GTP pyrophosphokinase